MLVSSATAQQMDTEAYNKWKPVVVIHYVVVGEFAGESEVSDKGSGAHAMAHVNDRVELTFDWGRMNT